VANVKDAFHLREQLGFVVKIRVFPIERMALGGFEATFSGGHANVEAEVLRGNKGW
jgi:hypothetical protein